MAFKTEITMGLLLMFLLLLIVPTAKAGEDTYNTNSGPGKPHEILDVKQDVFAVADSIKFSINVPEPLPFEITGWRIKIDEFSYVLCGYDPSSKRWLNTEGYGNNIYRTEWIRIESWLWVNPYSNQMDYCNVFWHNGLDFRKVLPDNGWAVYPGVETVYVYNRDPLDDFTIYDFKWYVSLTDYSDITLVPFDHSEPGFFFIEHGLDKFFNTPFGQLNNNAYLYFHYKIRNATDADVAEMWASHNIERVVGGIVVPIDKTSLLAPYFGSVLAILVVLVGTVIYVKHATPRKETQ